jgi:hypothetical protein
VSAWRARGYVAAGTVGSPNRDADAGREAEVRLPMRDRKGGAPRTGGSLLASTIVDAA